MSTRTKDWAVTCAMVIVILGISVFAWVKPMDAFSDVERRKLKQLPEISWKNIISGRFMEEFEAYTLDQFPLRNQFRNLKANVSMTVFGQQDNNNIYMEKGYVSKLEYPINEDSIENSIAKFRNLYDKFMMDKDMKVYFSIIPDKNYFLAQENGYLSMDYDVFLEKATEKADFMQYIDITSLLDLNDYYKTDVHWRQEHLVDVAEEIAGGMHAAISGEYEENTLENPFYGVYYGQSGMKMKPEEMIYLSNEVIESCVVYDYENDKKMGIYDMEKAYGNDPYEMFLSGSLSLITIDNPNAKTKKELILFRDSFGSSIAPLLAEGYAKTTLVDIRYIQPEILERYIEFNNQDVLFLYSTLVLNNSETIK